uniref:Macrophage migration inhibitory factor n=1 Tax=Angiostrongylus cantonensis TaxID=6313 RepID=A0A0K0D9S6_ANGCA
MPMIRVSTNVPDKDIPANFEERLTDLIAESMNKPRNRIAVEIMAGQRITHGASIQVSKLFVLQVESIGALSADDNIRHTQKITKFCQEILKVAQDKVFLNICHLYDGSTFVALLMFQSQ